ncbi:hypothetical protein [Enterovirga rhinocerotis]|uniref:Uncharacterized protein n=1 Tax=Enterovirga rhinocerotis TaxID=1339210 RepID=A0A4R7BNC6_9HYPH|nr:hypothetical protein [Enterovirga rhinocerotis]TDR85436.1 hypothetical protein EV668_4557 [Enterovirga rhinocerotis]
MIETSKSVLAAIALVAAATSAARAAECPDLLARGAKVADSYVMDFGANDTLYVYVMRLPGGSVETCTSRKKL